MKIPKQFHLMGHKITVEYSDKLLHTVDCLGEASYRDNKIILQKPSVQNPIPDSKQLEIFYHELTHFLLYFAQETELNKNEKAVALIASLITQYDLTKEGILK